jgi:uncharacterized protein (TIGR03000 family)
MQRHNLVCLIRPALLGAAFLLIAPGLLAQQDGRGAPNPRRVYPWQQPGYSGYESRNELWYTTPPSERAALAKKYHIFVTPWPVKNTEGDPDSALLIAHVPENALIWFDGEPTRQRGSLRRFLTPPLKPGTKYTYTVRIQWSEDGQWVGQEHQFPVHAGDAHCIDIIPSESPTTEKEVETNLAKLQPEDRKLAQTQRFCAVQSGIRLGSMGVPVKVVLKGHPVFLCCEACVEKAQSNPDETLQGLAKLKTKTPATPRP